MFLYTDEQAFNTLACYGNNWIEMPNLNALADTSTVFDRAYVTQPVCTPSRSTLMTGQWPHTNGCVHNNVALKPETRCLPEILPRGEYVTGHYGKWHLGDEIFCQHGFDEWVNYEDNYFNYYSEGRGRNVRGRSIITILSNRATSQTLRIGICLGAASVADCRRNTVSRHGLPGRQSISLTGRPASHLRSM